MISQKDIFEVVIITVFRCPTNIFSMKVALSFLNTVTNDSTVEANYITLKNLVTLVLFFFCIIILHVQPTAHR